MTLTEHLDLMGELAALETQARELAGRLRGANQAAAEAIEGGLCRVWSTLDERLRPATAVRAIKPKGTSFAIRNLWRALPSGDMIGLALPVTVCGSCGDKV